MTRDELVPIVEAAIIASGGSAKIVEVAKYIWKHPESDLRASGDLFFTWQYAMRWAANSLRRSRKMKPKDASPRGVWEICK